MDDNDSVDSNYSNYKTYYIRNDLDMNSLSYLSNVNIGNNFAGDNDNFNRLSHDILIINDSKMIMI